jgi:hypothetical protein
MSHELAPDDATFTDADLAAEREEEASRASLALRELAAQTRPEHESAESDPEALAFAQSLPVGVEDTWLARAKPASTWRPAPHERLSRRQECAYGRYRSQFGTRRQIPTVRRPSCARPRARRRRDGSRRQRTRGSSPSGSSEPGGGEPPAGHPRLESPRPSAALRFAALDIGRMVAPR